jgi:hypothetical protein
VEIMMMEMADMNPVKQHITYATEKRVDVA